MVESVEQELIQNIKNLFYQDQPIQAYQNYLVLKATFPQSLAVSEFGQSEEIVMLQSDHEILTDFIEESRTGRLNWTKYYDLPDYKIYYRYEQGQNLCSLFLEREINAPLLNFMAVLAEAQLYKEWVPMTSQSEVIHKVSHFRQCAEFTYKLPWPFYSRSVFIQACGMRIPEENACILTMSSAQGDSWLGVPLVRDPSMCYVDVNKTTFYCKALESGKILLRCTIHADPHLTYIPSSLINMGLKQVCQVFLNLIERKSQNLDQQYLSLIQDKKEFYEACIGMMNFENNQ